LSWLTFNKYQHNYKISIFCQTSSAKPKVAKKCKIHLLKKLTYEYDAVSLSCIYSWSKYILSGIPFSFHYLYAFWKEGLQ
jgi:hypothetical protein